MEHVLNEFKSVHGVTGAYIYNAKGHILANNLPTIYKEPKLLNIGKVLAKLHSAGGLNFSDVTDLFLFYEECMVICRIIADKSYLIILSEPSLNVNLVTLTMNLIKDDLVEAIKNAAPSPPPPQAAVQSRQPIIAEVPTKNEVPSKKGNISADSLVQDGPLSEQLKYMQISLAKIMGPMAKIIFMEAVEKWQSICVPSPDNLNKLMEILALEIKDAEKIKRYKGLLQK